MNPSNPSDYQKQPSVYTPDPATAATGIPVALSDQSQAHEVPWSTGLCDCFDDIPTCCMTFFCPCITFGRIAEIVDKGATSCGSFAAIYALISYLTGLGCLYSCVYRSKLRQQYLLKKSACGDCFVHCFCEECALCQEYRELKNRGLDPSLGWQGNLERQIHAVAMAPMVQGGMTR